MAHFIELANKENLTSPKVTLHYVDEAGNILGCASYRRNCNEYYVTIKSTNKSFFEADEHCARKALEGGKSTTEQLEEMFK